MDTIVLIRQIAANLVTGLLTNHYFAPNPRSPAIVSYQLHARPLNHDLAPNPRTIIREQRDRDRKLFVMSDRYIR